MNFATKLAQTRTYTQDNQLGVDSQEVYNEGILARLVDIAGHASDIENLLTFADSFYLVNVTATYTALPSATCKYITLINLTTNTGSILYRNPIGGGILTLEVGYSVRINTTNPSNIQVSSTPNTTLNLIVTS